MRSCTSHQNSGGIPMWSQLIPNAVMWTSATIGFLTILDFLLGDSQKRWLRRRLEDAWLWLASQTKGQIFYVIARPYVQIILGIIFYLLSFIIIVSQDIAPVTSSFSPSLFDLNNFTGPFWVEWCLFLIYMLCFGIFVHPKATNIVLQTIGWKNSSPTRLIVRTLLAVFVTGLLSLPAIFFQESDLGKRCIERPLLESDPSFITIKVCIPSLWLLVVAPVFTEIWATLLLMYFTIIWMVVAAFLLALLWLFQGLIYRLATYEKGPILALSALFGGIGAALKAFL